MARLILASVSIYAFLTHSAVGGSLLLHDWGKDPLREGFTLVDDSSGEHVFERAYETMGMTSWKIDTLSNGAEGVGKYRKSFAGLPAQYRLQAKLRIIDVNGVGGQALRFGNAARSWGALFSVAPDGDPVLSLEGTSFSMEIDGGISGFDLLFETIARTDRRYPEVYVNRTRVFTDYQGVSGVLSDGPNQTFEWGDLFESAEINGNANWSWIQFRRVPEPSFVILMLSGITCLCGARPSRLG
jgi:hypothetical protein